MLHIEIKPQLGYSKHVKISKTGKVKEMGISREEKLCFPENLFY
jgi:hypothetical protein